MAFVLAEAVPPAAFPPETGLVIVTAADGDVPVPGRLYVCPPGHALRIGAAGLELRAAAAGDGDGVEGLFESLAAEAGAAAVGVLLGARADVGAAGCDAILAAGGLLLACAECDPEGAGEGDLPRFSPADIAARLNDIGEGPAGLAAAREARDIQAFQAILALTSRASGVDLGSYKEGTLRRQVTRRSSTLGFQALDAYLAHLCANPEEIGRLHQSFMISVSAFFRDADVFDELERALQERIASKRPGDVLRVWVPPDIRPAPRAGR